MLTVRLGALAAVCCALAIAPAGALAGSSDVASTQSYVQANYTLVRAAAANIHRSEAELAGVLAQIRGECPKAAAGSPQNHDSEQLSDEVVGAIVVAGVHPSVGNIHSFIGKAGRLRWHSRGLTSQVQAYTGKLTALAALSAPSVCADVRAWAASGFHTLPASTVSFDAKYTPVWVALGELPASLKPFEQNQQRGLLHATSQLEAKISEYEARAVETYAEILDALELKQ